MNAGGEGPYIGDEDVWVPRTVPWKDARRVAEGGVVLEPPVPGETTREATARRSRNRHARESYTAHWGARCAICGLVRGNVIHETDPATSIEGPDYYAYFLDELHPFESAPTSEEP